MLLSINITSPPLLNVCVCEHPSGIVDRLKQFYRTMPADNNLFECLHGQNTESMCDFHSMHGLYRLHQWTPPGGQSSNLKRALRFQKPAGSKIKSTLSARCHSMATVIVALYRSNCFLEPFPSWKYLHVSNATESRHQTRKRPPSTQIRS